MRNKQLEMRWLGAVNTSWWYDWWYLKLLNDWVTFQERSEIEFMIHINMMFLSVTVLKYWMKLKNIQSIRKLMPAISFRNWCMVQLNVVDNNVSLEQTREPFFQQLHLNMTTSDVRAQRISVCPRRVRTSEVHPPETRTHRPFVCHWIWCDLNQPYVPATKENTSRKIFSFLFCSMADGCWLLPCWLWCVTCSDLLIYLAGQHWNLLTLHLRNLLHWIHIHIIVSSKSKE